MVLFAAPPLSALSAHIVRNLGLCILQVSPVLGRVILAAAADHLVFGQKLLNGHSTRIFNNY